MVNHDGGDDDNDEDDDHDHDDDDDDDYDDDDDDDDDNDDDVGEHHHDDDDDDDEDEDEYEWLLAQVKCNKCILWCFSCPHRKFAPGLALEWKSEWQEMLEVWQRETFTHRGLYTEKPLHRTAFTHKAFPNRSLCTQEHFDTAVFTVSARIIERSQEYKSTVKYRTFVLLRIPIPRGFESIL